MMLAPEGPWSSNPVAALLGPMPASRSLAHRACRRGVPISRPTAGTALGMGEMVGIAHAAQLLEACLGSRGA
jgi:hypothetical protein